MAVMHLLDPSTSDDAAPALCGAALRPVDAAEPDWTEDRDEATCEPCTVAYDEAAYDRQEDRGYGAEDYAADRAVEISRGID